MSPLPKRFTTVQGHKDMYGYPVSISIPHLNVESSDEDSGDVCQCSDCWGTKPKEGK